MIVFEPEVQVSSHTTLGSPGPRDDQLLLEQHHAAPSPATREALFTRFAPLARHLARRYPAHGEADDLQQIAALGLLKAIDRFDPSQGSAFSSFAVPTILGELKRHFRDHGWTVRPPRDVQELSGRLRSVIDELTAQLRRSPTPAELAERCDVSIEQLLETRAAATAHRPDRLDRPRDDDDTAEPSRLLGRDDPALASIEDDNALESWLAPLSERERIVMRLRFRDELRQREIGEQLGISQMHVSRLIHQSLQALRDTN
jgi:RNA polymerase sigma-B factor